MKKSIYRSTLLIVLFSLLIFIGGCTVIPKSVRKDLMVDYAEMTSFDFDSLDYQQVRDLHKVTGDSEYDAIPVPAKYGKFDLIDLFHSFITQKD